MRSFLGVTAHFIIDNTLHKTMQACKRFRGSHTPDNIYSTYQEMATEYNLSGRMSWIVTDNASNMLKSFALPGMEDATDLDDEESSDIWRTQKNYSKI